MKLLFLANLIYNILLSRVFASLRIARRFTVCLMVLKSIIASHVNNLIVFTVKVCRMVTWAVVNGRVCMRRMERMPLLWFML